MPTTRRRIDRGFGTEGNEGEESTTQHKRSVEKPNKEDRSSTNGLLQEQEEKAQVGEGRGEEKSCNKDHTSRTMKEDVLDAQQRRGEEKRGRRSPAIEERPSEYRIKEGRANEQPKRQRVEEEGGKASIVRQPQREWGSDKRREGGNKSAEPSIEAVGKDEQWVVEKNAGAN
eukprot:Gb_07593 [translate_table: standard]